MGDVKGRQLEQDYRSKAGAYFGRLLRRARVVSWQEIEDDLQQHLDDQQIDDLLSLDLLVRGQPRRRPDAPEVWLAVEVSAVVDRGDVKRAQRRADLLRKAGYRAIPAAAGEQTSAGTEDLARDEQVLLLQDGRIQFWNEALDSLLAA